MIGKIDHIGMVVQDMAAGFDRVQSGGAYFLRDRVIPGSRGSKVVFF